MIRVAQVAEDLKLGGLERVIENIAMHINPEKFKVFVLCLSRGGEIAERLIAGGKDVEILGIKNYHSPFSILKVARWFRQKKIDIVHTHGYPAGVIGRVAAIIAGIKQIFHHIHTTYLDMKPRNHFIERILSRFTDKVICCSNAVKTHAIKIIGISEKKLIVLYNGIPEPQYDKIVADDLMKSLNILRDSIIIGCVASLVPHKGHKYLFEAVKGIDGVCLLIVGDGSERKNLEVYADKLGIKNRVIFAGYKMDVASYLQMMDIFVLPSSEREGLGISIIEAMTMEKPVVATRIGGIPEVVQDGVTGILVSPKDDTALAKAIKKLLDFPDLMKEMGQNGRERYFKIFALKQMMIGLEKIYKGCD